MLQSSYTSNKIEAGCDEAGRGCLAGPVFAAAVILPSDFSHPDLRDSKKLNYQQRARLYDIIIAFADDYAISKINPKVIDKINILNASIKAMHVALKGLKHPPEFILVDGNRFKPFGKIPFECIVKGDDKFYSIAAASVLAKVSRDRYMERQAKKYPQYLWHQNKGYPTKAHRNAIMEYGVSPIHRMSFRLLPDETQLNLFD
jgi:ribonuclease HII